MFSVHIPAFASDLILEDSSMSQASQGYRFCNNHQIAEFQLVDDTVGTSYGYMMTVADIMPEPDQIECTVEVEFNQESGI